MSAILPTVKASPRIPMAEAFFIGAITSHSLAHGYVLKGKATGALYNLALQVAQILNCTQRPKTTEHPPDTLEALACGQCKDCRWIEQNAHPAVLTISRLTYQVNDKGELMTPDELEKQAKKSSSPTQIKTDQVGRLIQQLGISTEASRVVIFTDVEELPASIPSDIVPPYEWRGLENNESKSFHVRPLDRSIFNAASVNRLLKTLEEPPPRTLFFFLTETEEQLLETIVSRCQVIPCLSGEGSASGDTSPESYQAFLSGFIAEARQSKDVYALGAEFERFFIEEQGLSATQALTALQSAFRQRLLFSQPLDETHFATYRAIQQHIDTAIRMIEAKTNESQSLLNLFIKLSPHLKAISA